MNDELLLAFAAISRLSDAWHPARQAMRDLRAPAGAACSRPRARSRGPFGACRAHIESELMRLFWQRSRKRALEVFHPCARTRPPTKFLALAAEPAAALAIEAVRGTVSQLLSRRARLTT